MRNEELNEKLGKKKSAEISRLKRLMKKGVVSFSYHKISADGKVRKAKGTLDPKLIPAELKDDERVKSPNNDIVTYYDLKREDFRSFRNEEFIEITNVEK